MKNTFSVYTKMVDNKVHYFVKKFLILTEYNDLAPIPNGFGMHTNFNTACELAGIKNEDDKLKLFATIEGNTTVHAKVININEAATATPKVVML